MVKIKFFNLTIAQVVIRFYVMMAIALLIGFTQQWVLMAFIAGPIAASAILGVSFNFNFPKRAVKARKVVKPKKAIQLNWGKELQHAN